MPIRQKSNGTVGRAGARRFCALYLGLHAAALLLLLLALLGERLPIPLLSVCPLHAVGVYCPACGMTRALRAVLRFDPFAALRYNPCVFFLLLCVGYYEAVGLSALIGRRGAPRAVGRWPLTVLLAALLVFFVVRNSLLLVFSLDPTGDFL